MKQTNQNNTERATRMCRIDIRVTQAQADEIEKQMALCGMNRSEYCRNSSPATSRVKGSPRRN